MTHTINKIIKQAFKTFSEKLDKKLYNVHLESLQNLLKTLTATDIGLTPVKQDVRQTAPVSYVSIYECDTFTAGVFIIHKGMSIPLHDHPSMIGMCKVLYGTLKICSYDHLLNQSDSSSQTEGIAVCERPYVTLNSKSNCELLLPTRGNFHSIHSVDGDAAMFDILSPPYSETNDCQYYHALNHIESISAFRLLGITINDPINEKHVFLQKIQQPYDFYCNAIPYCGPTIDPL